MNQIIIKAMTKAIEAIDLNDNFGEDIDARHAAEEEAVSLLREALKEAKKIPQPIQCGDADDYDSMNVLVSSLKHARQQRYEDLLEQGFTVEGARVESHENIEMEFFYEKGAGLFAVESEAVETNTLISPYSGGEILDEELYEEKMADFRNQD